MSTSLYRHGRIIFASKYCKYQPMLSKTLRIGPLVLLETLTMAVGILLHTSYHIRCWSLVLIQISLTLFIVETLLAYHIISNSPSYRLQYLCRLAASSNSKLYWTLAWNQLILLVIIALCCLVTAHDGIRLVGGAQSMCLFSLYPLCLEQDVIKSSDGAADSTQLWILYVIFTMVNAGLLAAAQHRQYGYMVQLIKNRRSLAREFLGTELLLAEEAVLGKSEDSEGTQAERQCAICLNELREGERVANMKCKHVFHSGCLEQWLEKRKQCPYRCS